MTTILVQQRNKLNHEYCNIIEIIVVIIIIIIIYELIVVLCSTFVVLIVRLYFVWPVTC